MSYEYSEDNFVELPTMECLEELGWEVHTACNMFLTVKTNTTEERDALILKN